MWGKQLCSRTDMGAGAGCESEIIAGLTVSAAGRCINCSIISAAAGYELCVAVSVPVSGGIINAGFIPSQSVLIEIRMA